MVGGELGRVGSKVKPQVPVGTQGELAAESRVCTFQPKLPPAAARCVWRVASGTFTFATVPDVADTI
ncbi:hypothetical protein GCM10010253_48700 [Streptomyces badius]|uniref:Uncharacterized protein n=1 Tax=Streptomyces badius TaxID=1941 RepID=A0ABQ2TG66_STRBA|nr:hypothetical protein GCM10010253_48700 [Streptomyces badius]